MGCMQDCSADIRRGEVGDLKAVGVATFRTSDGILIKRTEERGRTDDKICPSRVVRSVQGVVK